MKKREITIPTIVGLLVVMGGLLSGLWLVQRQISQSSQAAAEQTPKEVTVANVTDASFAVTWITDKALSGYVQYGEGGGNPDLVVSDDRDQQKGSIENYFTHFVTVKGLKPDASYKFKIGSGNDIFGQGGVPYEIRTGTSLSQTPVADVAYGQVITTSSEPADGALVYLTIPGGNIQAALAKPSGSWVIPLSTIRTSDLGGYITYDRSTTQIEIAVNDGPMGQVRVVTTTANDNPVPEITLGQDKSFTENTGNQAGTATNSGESKLGLIPAPATEEKALKLLTPQSGEGISSARPEIIGMAPANSEVIIEIHSTNTISGRVVADSSGKFSYSVPSDLPPGEHTITISTVVNGVVQKITRSFTVYAAGESFAPAFSATPSGTLAPTVKPTKTPTPTITPRPTVIPKVSATPRPTATPKPTATPRVSATPGPSTTVAPSVTPGLTASPTIKPTPTPKTQATLPTSGEGDLTTLVLILGASLVVSGWWWYRKSA